MKTLFKKQTLQLHTARENKAKVREELTRQFRIYFENKLSETVLTKKHRELPAVKKISQKILTMLDANSAESIYAIFNNHQSIVEELYSDTHFGRLGTKDEKPKGNLPEKLLNDIRKILQNDNASLDQVIHIHSIFIHRIFDKLVNKFDGYNHEVKNRLVDTLFTKNYFSEQNRGRICVSANAACTQAYGFVSNPYFGRLFKTKLIPHRRAVDVFQLDTNSKYALEIGKSNLPFVAGPSGHTGSLLLGALVYGELDNEHLKQYLLAIFAYLSAGGNHSFHEVMIIGRLIGLEYKDGEYLDVLPKSLLEDPEFKVLQQGHSLYLMR